MAEEDARGVGSVDVGRRLDLPGRDGRGWTVAGVDPKSGDVILTRPQGETVVTLTISSEQYEKLKTVGPNARYRKPSLRFRLGDVYTSGERSANVAAYDDVGKRALVETQEDGQAIRRWVDASALDRVSTGQTRLEEVLQEASTPQQEEGTTRQKPVNLPKGPLSVAPEPVTPAEAPASKPAPLASDEEAVIEEATEEVLEERETPKAAREALRSKRTEERIVALKQDPEADLFVRLVAAGTTVPDPAFRQKVSAVRGELTPVVLAQLATEYMQEQASRGVEDWRTVTRQAVRTVADRPANDPVYQAMVVRGTTGTREERLQSFVIQYPDKAKAYAFTDQEIAVTLQAVGRGAGVAPSGGVDVELEATLPGTGSKTGGLGVAAAAGAAVLASAEALAARKGALIDQARSALAGYAQVSAGYRRKLDGVRDGIKALGQKTQGINAALTPTASMEQVRQYQGEITKADTQRRELQDEQVKLTVQAQGVNADAEQLSRALRQFEQASPTEEGMRAFEGRLGQVPASVKQAVKKEDPSSIPAKRTTRVGGVPAQQATAQRKDAVRRIGGRRAVGRGALAAGIFGAATSLFGAQQSSRLSEQGIGGDHDAYSEAFGGGTSRRPVIEAPGRTYTAPDEGEAPDRLPTAGEESQRIRAKERTMRDTLAFHAGEETVGGEEGVGEEGGQARRPRGDQGATFEEEAPEEETSGEMDRASQLLNAQQQARGAQEAAQAAEGQDAQGGDLPGQLGGIQRIGRFYNMTKYSSAATGIGILYTILLMNVSLVAKLINAKSIPKQTFIEDVATIFLDVAIIGTSLMMLVPLMLGVAALIGVGLGIDAGVSALLDLFR